MASNHRVTDLEKIPVRISKDEAPTQLSVVGPLFISSLLFHLSRALLDMRRFSLFRSVYSIFHNRLDLIRDPAFYWVFLFSQFILVCFVICKNKKSFVRSSSIDQRFRGLPGQGLGLGQLPVLAIHCFSLGLPFCFSSYIVYLRCTSEGGSLDV